MHAQASGSDMFLREANGEVKEISPHQHPREEQLTIQHRISVLEQEIEDRAMQERELQKQLAIEQQRATELEVPFNSSPCPVIWSASHIRLFCVHTLDSAKWEFLLQRWKGNARYAYT